MTCVAIDDERPGLDLICNYIEGTPFLEMKGAFSSYADALDFLMKNHVDLVFSDIELNSGINGMQLYSVLPYRPMVIFITAYSNYAVKSYSLSAVDYLLKPVSYERFLTAANKAYEQFRYRQPSSQTHSEYIFVKTENKLQKVLLKEVLYLEAYGDYVKIHFQDSPILMSMQSLTSFEAKLSDNFVRVHRSYIVALDKIDEVARQRIVIGSDIIPISDSYKKDFFDRINL